MARQLGEHLLFSLLAFAFGVSFSIVLACAALREEPINDPAKFFLRRVLASLSAGGVAAVIPGFFEFQWKKQIQAGGALAVFVIVFLVTPPSLLLPKKDKTPLAVMDHFNIVRINSEFSGETGPYVIRCGTNGAGINARSLTHSSQAVFQEVEAASRSILPKPLKHVYTLEIPQSCFSANPILVHNRMTFIDSFVKTKGEWVALQSRYPTQVANLIAVLPENRPFLKAEVVFKHANEAMETVLKSKAVNHSHSKHLLHTCIADIQAGDAVGIQFDW